MSSKPAAAALVTVIVPTIGRPEFIVDTLRSVLAQTYTRLQILISDNAPAQPTAPLLAAAGIDDARIEIVHRPVRLGFSAHMNACIAQALGTYLMIVSDDDLITPGYVAEMVEAMSADPQIKVCLGRQVQINEHDRGMPTRPESGRQREILDGVDFLTRTLARTLQTGVLTYISMFVRRHEILEVGGFRDYPDGSHADNFIVFSLAIQGRVALLSHLMFYRVYLASSGLRTPFPALLEATRAYTRDASTALRGTSVSHEDSQALRALVKAANTRLLIGRLRDVYRHRMNPLALLVCMAQVLRFKLSRVSS
jgi:glycosyltransferase involved in cell wall biosynthesis